MLDHVVITPVSKAGFGSVKIPCTSTQDPTFERHPAQKGLCAKYSVATSLDFLSLVVIRRLEPRALHMLSLSSVQPES